MRGVTRVFTKYYGSYPLHLLTLVAGFALAGYVLLTITPAALWNPHTWWQSIIVWFAAAVIGHDLLLYPIYALADAVIGRSVPRQPANIPAHNYIRIPALGAGLTLLVFLPGIIEQGAATYRAATGQTQQLFLGRWLILVAAMFTASAIWYVARVFRAGRRPELLTEKSLAASLEAVGSKPSDAALTDTGAEPQD
ncbi:hypothetical protein [Mycobacterium asiaticum]|uniref:Uncharacterized protein n=1 Tax=Mycobacterium asiaticum TaxID=1790 RepID=A0A1A3CB48_MYCAS|nr:hypothetical protein [Mycobacterium asiaticum]OBI83617.1 hypothetical protein A9X01_20555 [Mycobacterium asiaticum]